MNLKRCVSLFEVKVDFLGEKACVIIALFKTLGWAYHKTVPPQVLVFVHTSSGVDPIIQEKVHQPKAEKKWILTKGSFRLT